jgi:hypothetical protein
MSDKLQFVAQIRQAKACRTSRVISFAFLLCLLLLTALLTSVQAVTTAENVLKQLILRNRSAADALAETFANRPELTRLRVQQDINKTDTQFFKNQTLRRVDLQATVFSYGLAANLSNFFSAKL